MKTNKRTSSGALSVLVLMIQAALPPQALAGSNQAAVGQWSVLVDEVDAGGVSIEPAFRVAIYENLPEELARTRQFKQVFRGGDRSASNLPDILILKTAVQSYTPGSETRRAVTTVSGATKLSVRSQLCTPEGKVVLERVVNGNVRFFGGTCEPRTTWRVMWSTRSSSQPCRNLCRPAVNSKHQSWLT